MALFEYNETVVSIELPCVCLLFPVPKVEWYFWEPVFFKRVLKGVSNFLISKGHSAEILESY